MKLRMLIAATAILLGSAFASAEAQVISVQTPRGSVFVDRSPGHHGGGNYYGGRDYYRNQRHYRHNRAGRYYNNGWQHGRGYDRGWRRGHYSRDYQVQGYNQGHRQRYNRDNMHHGRSRHGGRW